MHSDERSVVPVFFSRVNVDERHDDGASLPMEETKQMQRWRETQRNVFNLTHLLLIAFPNEFFQMRFETVRFRIDTCLFAFAEFRQRFTGFVQAKFANERFLVREFADRSTFDVHRRIQNGTRPIEHIERSNVLLKRTSNQFVRQIFAWWRFLRENLLGPPVETALSSFVEQKSFDKKDFFRRRAKAVGLVDPNGQTVGSGQRREATIGQRNFHVHLPADRRIFFAQRIAFETEIRPIRILDRHARRVLPQLEGWGWTARKSFRQNFTWHA